VGVVLPDQRTCCRQCGEEQARNGNHGPHGCVCKVRQPSAEHPAGPRARACVCVWGGGGGGSTCWTAAAQGDCWHSSPAQTCATLAALQRPRCSPCQTPQRCW
jgi:hypothetical protein